MINIISQQVNGVEILKKLKCRREDISFKFKNVRLFLLNEQNASAV